MGKQTSKTYALFEGREKVYIGEAANTERRAEQHRDEGKRFNRVEITSRPMLKANAQRREADQLAAYRRGHSGKNPRYNKDDDG
jgi:predicted GIY-YIG superfamily endonuclease